MTPGSRVQRIAAPAAAALATAAALTGVLWAQRSRDAWPFEGATAAEHAAHSGGAAATTEATPTHGRVAVDVSAATAAALGIRVETVGREPLKQALRTVATVVPDESKIAHVHTRVAGWVEQLDVNTTGELVRAGQPLARVFSQELLSSQAEYLAVRRNTSALGITSAVLASGRTRLAVLGMSADDIDAIERTGEPTRLVTVAAPRTGVIVNRGVTVGTSVDPSTTLLTIADLSTVWILAEVPEASIRGIRVGATAMLDFPASGRPPFAARVDFVYPTLTERTRTLRVRLSAANASGMLRPGLYGTAAFELAGEPAITIPRDAVVDTGLQQHVFVAAGDRFEPRPVMLGVQLADRVEVRAGLEEGDRIVAAGVFLLDSESRLRATGGTGGHQHGTPAQAAAQAAPDPHAGHRAGAPMPETPDPHARHRE